MCRCIVLYNKLLQKKTKKHCNFLSPLYIMLTIRLTIITDEYILLEPMESEHREAAVPVSLQVRIIQDICIIRQEYNDI